MRVFLHIGSHKTGTTAIQEFLFSNRKWFESKGLLYPSFDLIGGKAERSHLGLIDRLGREIDYADTESPRALLQAIRGKAEQQSANVLFSAESLFRLNAPHFNRIIDVLSEVFSGCRITVVASLRERAEFAESLYRNGFRAMVKLPLDFDTWIAKSRSNFNYEERIFRYVNALSADAILLPYSETTKVDFVSYFISTLGVDPSGARIPARQKNPSLDVVDCLAKYALMKDSTDDRLSRAFNNFAFKSRIVTDYGFLDEEREVLFNSHFEQESRKLIALAPELGEVLDTSTARLRRKRIDEECLALAQQRAEAFAQSRTEEQWQ